jgi:hypothetical protein
MSALLSENQFFSGWRPNSKLRPITDVRYQLLTNFPTAKDVAGKDRRGPLEEQSRESGESPIVGAAE